MAALPGQETQPTQGNHGGSTVQQHTSESKTNWFHSFIALYSIICCIWLINHDCLKEEFTLGIYICWVTFVCNVNNSLLLPLLLQSHLKEIQVAFISVLSDPDGKKEVLSNQMVRSVCSLLTPASAIQMYLQHHKTNSNIACSSSFLSPHPLFLLLSPRVESGCGV